MTMPKKMLALELEEQAAVVEWWAYACRQYGLDAFDLFHIPNEGTGSRVRGKIMQRQGLRPGCPDLMLSAPVHPFHGLFLEMKRETKAAVPSAEQRVFHARLKERGYAVQVCHGASEARLAIKRYLAGEEM